MTDQKANARARAKAARDDLSDNYIKSLLYRGRATDCDPVVQQRMIKLYRMVVVSKRAIRDVEEHGFISKLNLDRFAKCHTDFIEDFESPKK